jgi:beta-glucuronidase
VRRLLLVLLAGGLLAAVLASVGSAPGHRRPGAGGDPPAPLPPAPVPLQSGWTRHADPREQGRSEAWGSGHAPSGGWRAVAIPNDFNPDPTPAGDRGQVFWYRDTFTGPPAQPGRGWAVSFTGVRRDATVWLNGRPLGTSNDPYAPFSLGAPNLRAGRRNTLIVRVDNVRSMPEDWWNWGGITGPVSLVPVGRLALEDLGLLPALGCDYRCGSLRLTATVVNHSPRPLAPAIQVAVRPPGSHQEAQSSQRSYPPLAPAASEQVAMKIAIPSPRLWSPAHPSLYQARVSLQAGGRTEQRLSLAVGMRSVSVRGGILYLNGARLWLHGASIQEDTDGQGAALTGADIARIVSRLQALGANVTRAHYELDPRLLDALDRAGIMLWAQPAVDHDDRQLATAPGRARALALTAATLLADRNHPSVIVDSLGNELSPTPNTTPGTLAYLRQALALARSLNPGVPVGLDVYGFPGYRAQRFYRYLNALGLDDYFGWYQGTPRHSLADFSGLAPYLRAQHARYPEQALVVTEYGAESSYYGPAGVKGTYSFQSEYLQRTWSVLDSLPFLNGAIYWTLQEFAVAPGWTGGATLPAGHRAGTIHHKGLIAYDGWLKPAFITAQRLFAAPPAYAGPRTPRPPTPAAFSAHLGN